MLWHSELEMAVYVPIFGEVVRLRGRGGEFYVTRVDCDLRSADLIRLTDVPYFEEKVPWGCILPRSYAECGDD
jgi:hypothetical protein